MTAYTLVVNPGSASRKYGLFKRDVAVASLHFEFQGGTISCTVRHGDEIHTVQCIDVDLSSVVTHVAPFLHEYRILTNKDTIAAIGIRVVAPSDTFLEDKIVDAKTLQALKSVEHRVPLHIAVVLAEIEQLREHFVGTPIVMVSDSAFHATKPDFATSYGLTADLTNRLGIKRYGYHGVSVGSIVRKLTLTKQLFDKVIICHLGSGSSVSAVLQGRSVETTMGFTPLEGLVMATRSGTLDTAAALAVKRELNLSDTELERFLNKQSGLLGVSGTSDDIRELLKAEAKGDDRARLSLAIYVYRIQQAIGQMAASMNGATMLVFTATVGERSSIIRERVIKNLSYLGFTVDETANNRVTNPQSLAMISRPPSKPIAVIPTDESVEIARRTALVVYKRRIESGKA